GRGAAATTGRTGSCGTAARCRRWPRGRLRCLNCSREAAMAHRDHPQGFPVRAPVGWRPPPPPGPPAAAFSPLRTTLLVLFMMAVCAGVGLLTVSLPRRPAHQTVETGPEPKPEE